MYASKVFLELMEHGRFTLKRWGLLDAYPKDTPQDVVDKLIEIVTQAASSSNFAAFGEKFGFAPTWIPGPEYETQMREDLKLFQEIKKKYIDN
jgi:tripartite-type tricarboxylate transporter receptor subunit TctC